ncbi:hypothetical protein ACFFPI_00005, partial [Arthrobacter methylotrophus]
RTGWTPTTASKNSPPGWTSPSQRHYPSEHQDWEPPHWPHHIPITETQPGPDPSPDEELPAYPGPEMPPDPFPDWHSFTAAHPWPDADMDDMNDPFPESSAFEGA